MTKLTMEDNGSMRLNSSDHDLLIELRTIVISMASDLKELKDGTSVRLADLDLRLRKVEELGQQYSPEPLVAELKNNSQWIRDFETSKKLLLTIITLISGLIGFSLNLGIRYFGWIK